MGAFLAELSVFFCHNNNYPNVNAVTFESPGSEEAIEMLQSNIKERRIEVKKLDILGYVGNPKIEPSLGKYGWIPGLYTSKCHSVNNFIIYFKENFYSKNNTHFPYYVFDWPASDWSLTRFFKNSPQLATYFKYVEWDKKNSSYKYSLGFGNNAFILTYKGHYQVQKQYKPSLTLPLRHFSVEMQSFFGSFL